MHRLAQDDAQANNGLGFMYLHGHGVEKVQ